MTITGKRAESARDDASGDLAVIGEGPTNESAVSIQVLQNIYHELTGKTESVSKSYADPFRIRLGDFEQLNHRVLQCCEQYAVKALNCSAKVFYANDTQETFSSFERFRHFNAGSASPVESVLVTYNFMIILPKTQKVQSYTLSVRVASPISVSKKFRDSMPFDLPKIIKAMGQRTAIVTVNYVDYVVARTLLDTADVWLQTVERAQPSPAWQWIVARSHGVPVLSRYIAFSAAAFALWFALPLLVPPDGSAQQLARFMLGGAVALGAAYKLAHHIGLSAERSLDRWSALAYVELTAGDKRLVEEATSGNRRSVTAAAVKALLSLLVAVASKLIVGHWAGE